MFACDVMWSNVYLSIYRTSYRLLFIPWYKFAIPCLPLDWRVKIEDSTETLSSNLQSSQSAGGDWRSEEKILWYLQSEGEKASIRLPIPFHSIRPSFHPTHPYCPSIHPSCPFIYISTYLAICSPIYLPIYLAIYLSIHPSNYILSYNVAILGLHVDWRFKKEQSSVQRRVQRVPTRRSIEKPPNRL